MIKKIIVIYIFIFILSTSAYQIKTINIDNGLNSNQINNIVKIDSDIYLLMPGSIQKLYSNPVTITNLSNTNNYTDIIDKNQFLYISHNYGLIKYNTGSETFYAVINNTPILDITIYGDTVYCGAGIGLIAYNTNNGYSTLLYNSDTVISLTKDASNSNIYFITSNNTLNKLNLNNNSYTEEYVFSYDLKKIRTENNHPILIGDSVIFEIADNDSINTASINNSLPTSKIYDIKYRLNKYYISSDTGIVICDTLYGNITSIINPVKGLKTENIRNIITDVYSNLLISSIDNGITKINFGLEIYNKGTNNNFVGEGVDKIVIGANNKTYIATYNVIENYIVGSGINIIQDDTLTVYSMNDTSIGTFPIMRINDMVLENSDTLWIVSDSGLYNFNGTTFTQHYLPFFNIKGITANDSVLWLASDSGLIQYIVDTYVLYTNTGINLKDIHYTENKLFISSNKSIIVKNLRDNSIDTVYTSDYNIKDLYIKDEFNIYIATENGLFLAAYSQPRAEWFNELLLNANNIISMTYFNNMIYFISANNLLLLRKINNQYNYSYLSEVDGYTFTEIIADNESLWIGTIINGSIRYYPHNISPIINNVEGPEGIMLYNAIQVQNGYYNVSYSIEVTGNDDITPSDELKYSIESNDTYTPFINVTKFNWSSTIQSGDSVQYNINTIDEFLSKSLNNVTKTFTFYPDNNDNLIKYKNLSIATYQNTLNQNQYFWIYTDTSGIAFPELITALSVKPYSKTFRKNIIINLTQYIAQNNNNDIYIYKRSNNNNTYEYLSKVTNSKNYFSINNGGIYILSKDKIADFTLTDREIYNLTISPRVISDRTKKMYITLEASIEGNINISLFNTNGYQIKNLADDVSLIKGKNVIPLDFADNSLKNGAFILKILVTDSNNNEIYQENTVVVVMEQ